MRLTPDGPFKAMVHKGDPFFVNAVVCLHEGYSRVEIWLPV